MSNSETGNNQSMNIPPISLNIDSNNLDEIILKMEKINQLSTKVTAIVPIDDYLLKQSDVATILGVNAVTVGKLIKKGYLKSLKLGNIKVRKKEVDRFMNYLEQSGESLENIY